MPEIDDKTKEIIERKFIDYFGMTVEQFDELESDKQEELIQKAAKLRSKMKNTKHKGLHSKYRYDDIYTYYPIKTRETIKEKIKSILKK